MPPRFAPIEAAGDWPDLTEVDRLSLDRPAKVATDSPPAPGPVDGAGHAVVRQAEPQLSPPSPAPASQAPAFHRPAARSELARTEGALPPAAHAPVRPPEPGAARLAGAVDPVTLDAAVPAFRRPVDSLAPIASRRADIAADEPGRRGAAPLGDRRAPFAPLSEAAVAGRAEDSRRAEPVIHVTIDRIDVRAPAPAPPAQPARRASAEPSVSLADFLSAGPLKPRG